MAVNLSVKNVPDDLAELLRLVDERAELGRASCRERVCLYV